MELLALAPAILGGLQTLGGIFGVTKGPRPKWQIPGAASENVANARTMASATTRPGNQQYLDQIAKNAASQTSTITRNAGSGTQALAALGGVEQRQNQASANNAVANDTFRFNAKQNLQNVLNNYAGLQREKFISDVMQPYQERAQTKNALISSGLQNVFGGLNSLANQKLQLAFMNGIYGNSRYSVPGFSSRNTYNNYASDPDVNGLYAPQ